MSDGSSVYRLRCELIEWSFILDRGRVGLLALHDGDPSEQVGLHAI
jgi:hypothetical protein